MQFKFSLFLWFLLLPAFRCDSCVDITTFRRKANGVDEFPFIVFMTMENKFDTSLPPPYHACGIIIDRNMILTRAYHCEVSPSNSFHIRAGMSYVLRSPREDQQVDFLVSEYALHPQRNRSTYDESKSVSGYTKSPSMDFCLLRLKTNMTLGPGIQKAALPLKGEAPQVGMEYIVTGWGPFDGKGEHMQKRIRLRQGDRGVTLYHHYGKRLSDTSCKSAWSSELGPELFCIDYACFDMRTAYGDDGGPVIEADSWKVMGMVVNMDMQGDSPAITKPQVNAMLHFAVDWINQMRVKWSS